MRRKKYDDIDIKIISELQKNGRAKILELARKLNLTHPSVHERLKKLFKEDIMKIQADINVCKLRLKAVFINAEVKNPSAVAKFIEKCNKCGKLVLVGFGSGEYNLFIIFVGNDLSELRAMIEKNLRSDPDVNKINVSFGEIIYPKYLPVKVDSDYEHMAKEICTNCDFFRSKMCKGCAAIISRIKSL